LIDVADQFIELDSHIEEITKAESRYTQNHHSGSHYIQRNSGSFTRVHDDEEVEANREAAVER
jgi:Fe2+ or Zn2+ uptake regulation protein